MFTWIHIAINALIYGIWLLIGNCIHFCTFILIYIFLHVSTQEGLIFCLSSYFSPKSDRNKLYAHELESCANKIPLHYETCNAVPVFAGEWSIAVDDCMPFLNARFEDVGQCDHIDLRKDDPYWQNHLRCTKI